MTEAVEILIKADDKASQKFAAVAASADKASQKTNSAFQATARTAKTTTELVGAMATFIGDEALDGVSQLAGMLAQATERASAFSDVANKGAGGALAFKLGMAGLAATAGGIVGKALGDLIFQTKQWDRAMERARDTTAKLGDEMLKLSAKGFGNELEDIELIRDPEAKKAAISELLQQTEKDVAAVTAALKQSQAEADRWADAWILFTDTRKEAAAQAVIDLENDKKRLEQLKAQREAVRELGSERTQQIAAIKAAQAAEDAQAEAMKQAQDDRKKAVQEYWKAVADARKEAMREQEKVAEEAQREVQRVEDLIAAEQERLALQRIELEQGKEIARVHELVGQGVEETIAKQLAAEEAAIESLRKRKNEEGKPKTEKENKAFAATDLMASQSRLLTRGQSSPMDETNKLLQQAQKHAEQLARFNEQQLEQQKMIAQNTANTLTVRPTT